MPKAKKSNAKSMSALNARITSIRKDINPLVRVMSIKGNPKAVNVNRTVYVTRTYAITKQSASSVATLSYADIISAVAPGGDPASISDCRVSKIKLWNTSIGSSLRATLLTSKLIDSSTNPASIQGIDYGTSSSLAGLGFDIPDTLAVDITGATPQSDNVVSATTGGATDTVLFHVSVRISV